MRGPLLQREMTAACRDAVENGIRSASALQSNAATREFAAPFITMTCSWKMRRAACDTTTSNGIIRDRADLVCVNQPCVRAMLRCGVPGGAPQRRCNRGEPPCTCTSPGWLLAA